MRYLVLFVSIVMFGCSIEPPRPIVTQYQTQLVKISDVLLMPCSVSEPPDTETYILSSYIDKESILTDYSLQLLNDLKTCNDQIARIKQLQIDQDNLIKEKNNESKTNAKIQSGG